MTYVFLSLTLCGVMAFTMDIRRQRVGGYREKERGKKGPPIKVGEMGGGGGYCYWYE